MTNTFEEEQNHEWLTKIRRGLYLLIEIPMFAFDKATARIRDRMPHGLKVKMPFLACREYSLYFKPEVSCKIAAKYEHKGLMRRICEYYCENGGACGRYLNNSSERKD